MRYEREPLMALFEQHRVTELVDIARPPVVANGHPQ
jgi:hypothetical protein